MSAMQLNAGKSLSISNNQREWLKALLMVGLMFALWMAMTHLAYASDGTEFEEASAKFEGWVKGNLGKLAGFVALGVGAVVAAVKKDWSWFFGAIILAMGVGIIAGIINASFTATI